MHHHVHQHPAHRWVDPAPFGAHLRHLSATTGVPWAVVAKHAGVSIGLASRLVRRPVSARLPLAEAQRLLSVSATGVTELRSAWVPSGPTRTRIVEIERRGHDPLGLAQTLDIPSGVIQPALGDSAGVRIVTALAVQILLDLSDRLLTGRGYLAAVA